LGIVLQLISKHIPKKQKTSPLTFLRIVEEEKNVENDDCVKIGVVLFPKLKCLIII
jgi:hypothetical protein